MKKLGLWAGLLSTVAFASSTFTTYYNLEKPADNDTNWGSGYRSNLNTIDTQLHVANGGITDHIASVTAHTAAHITATPGSLCSSETNVQDYLDCLDENVGGYVTVVSAQTISGQKTFSASIVAPASIQLSSETPGKIAIVDGAGLIASSSADSSYLDGLSANVQTQFQARLVKSGDTMSGALYNSSGFVGPVTGNVVGSVTGSASLNILRTADTMTGSLGLSYANVTPDRAAYIDSSRIIRTSDNVSSTELEYLDGVTAAIQTQINAITSAGAVLKTGDTMTGALVLPNGTAAAPSLSFIRDQSLGIYSPGAGRIGFATAGVFRGDIRANGTNGGLFLLNADSTDAANILLNSAASKLQIYGHTGTNSGGGIELFGGSEATTPHIITFRTNNTERLRIQNGNSASTPSLVLAADTDTGSFHPAADQLAWALGGVERFRLSTANTNGGGAAKVTSDGTADNGALILQTSDANFSTNLMLDNGGAGVAGLAIEGATAGTFLTGTTANALVLYTTSTRPVQIATNNTVRLSINTSGNITHHSGTAPWVVNEDENLKVIRGNVLPGAGTCTIQYGAGFTATDNVTGQCNINFTVPFSALPSCDCWPPENNVRCVGNGKSISSVTVNVLDTATSGGTGTDGVGVDFTCIGPK